MTLVREGTLVAIFFFLTDELYPICQGHYCSGNFAHLPWRSASNAIKTISWPCGSGVGSSSKDNHICDPHTTYLRVTCQGTGRARASKRSSHPPDCIIGDERTQRGAIWSTRHSPKEPGDHVIGPLAVGSSCVMACS